MKKTIDLKMLDLDFIKRRRLEKNYTTQQMADSIGVKYKSTYSKLENGKYNIKADLLPALAKTLECSILDLYK